MESTLSIIASFCGILGFFISLFAVNSVNNIKKDMKKNNKVTVSGSTKVGGDFVGRDKKS